MAVYLKKLTKYVRPSHFIFLYKSGKNFLNPLSPSGAVRQQKHLF